MGTPSVHAPPVERFVPVIPTELRQYNSYEIDPQWQTKFTIIWTSVLAFSTVVSLPYVWKAWKSGRLYSGLLVSERLKHLEDVSSRSTSYGDDRDAKRSITLVSSVVRRLMEAWQTISLLSIPIPSFWKSGDPRGQKVTIPRRRYLSLSLGQLFIVLAYVSTVIACIVTSSQLKTNSNRAGFIGVATLPVIFLLALKSPLPLPIFLPSMTYEQYNFLHRWAGRTLFLAVTIHGGLWINQFLTTDQLDQMTAEKTKRGLLSYGLLGGIVVTSLKPVRRLCYQVFWLAHVILVTGFFTAICYHTPYTRPWIYPCIAIYAYDVFVRFLRFRIKDAVISAVDATQTMIYIPDCDKGWLPTQHVFIRVFRGPGVFESHPFTITNAPSPSSSLAPRGIVLYAGVSGDWTRRLHSIAADGTVAAIDVDDYESESDLFLALEKQGYVSRRSKSTGKSVKVVIDGPYGGLKADVGSYREVLVVAGGSGVTFLLGTIEEVLRIHRLGKSCHKVTAVWIVANTASVESLAPTLVYLRDRASSIGLELELQIHLTQSTVPPTPDTLPSDTLVSLSRPDVTRLIHEHVPYPTSFSSESGEDRDNSGAAGLFVVACGPENLVLETRHAVATLSVQDRVRCGGVDFHGECYAL